METNERKAKVPARALVVSAAALLIPIAGTTIAPSWVVHDFGVLLWLTALVPAFLLTYHRGWWGASVGLAAGMAVLSLTQAALIGLGLASPNWPLLMAVVVVLIAICVGIGVLAELLERERAAASAMALTDGLTGLPNRRHASVFLESAFAAAERGQPLTVVLFDLDHFKDFNDRHGHPAGDEVLRGFGEVLLRFTRKMNLSARYGGEEFISILNNCSSDGAEIYTGRVLEALKNGEFQGSSVTASAGIAQYEPGMGSAEVLVAAADRALYMAKGEGRDSYRVAPRATPEPEELVEERREAEGKRRRASGDPPRERTEGPLAEHPSRLRERAREFVAAGINPGGLPGGGETVLLVEDDRYARRALAAVLSRLGYRVLAAESGASALESLDEPGIGSVDLLVTDLVMPGMSGFTLAERVLERDGELRVLYVSGHAHGAVSWAGAPGTVRSFLRKPFDAGDFARAVRSVLDAEESRVEAEETRHPDPYPSSSPPGIRP